MTPLDTLYQYVIESLLVRTTFSMASPDCTSSEAVIVVAK